MVTRAWSLKAVVQKTLQAIAVNTTVGGLAANTVTLKVSKCPPIERVPTM